MHVTPANEQDRDQVGHDPGHASGFSLALYPIKTGAEAPVFIGRNSYRNQLW
jgi:hypothetical protein